MTQLNIATLKATFSGNIVLPDDDTYNTARVTYAVKDAMPAVVAQAMSNEDIAAVISFSKANHLQISVRSGGHSAAGFSTNNNGLVLDLSHMNSIEVLDEKTGLVRLGTGAQWGDVASVLATHGLAISSGDTKTVAVGGLTLGGGIGWMLRKYGYATDSLVAAEVVLANGSVVTASESENSDLFWSLRGGGGNFGVVTSFEFKAHPLGKVVESTITYKADGLQKIISGWRDHMRVAPEDLTSFMTILPPGPAGPDPFVMIMSCYANENLDHANLEINPLRQLGPIVNDTIEVKNYADVLQIAHPPEGVTFEVKNMFTKVLSDELIAQLSSICGKPGSPVVQLRIMGGAIDKISPDAMALSHRGNEAFLFAGFPTPIGATPEQKAKSLQVWEKLAVYSSGTYSNFLSTNTENDIAGIYPENTYRRLTEVKRKYDPENIFSHNFNIKPATN